MKLRRPIGKCDSNRNSMCDEFAHHSYLPFHTIFSQCPDFGRIIEVLLNDGVSALSEKCQMLPGTPLKPMLAHPTKGVQEVLQRFDGIKFTCEYKYDGERAQVSVQLHRISVSVVKLKFPSVDRFTLTPMERSASFLVIKRTTPVNIRTLSGESTM